MCVCAKYIYPPRRVALFSAESVKFGAKPKNLDITFDPPNHSIFLFPLLKFIWQAVDFKIEIPNGKYDIQAIYLTGSAPTFLHLEHHCLIFRFAIVLHPWLWPLQFSLEAASHA